MSSFDWITMYESTTDPRMGVLYDGSNISANDGDVCISFITHFLIKDLEKPYCLDIGADECWWAIFCCEQNPTARVDAFEPGPISESFAEYLSEKYPSITLHNKAVSNTPGFLYLSEEGACSNSRTNSGRIVEAITLDPFLEKAERVHLIKIDVEGHELQILETLSKYSEKIDTIIFEFSVHWYADTLEEAMDKTYNTLSLFFSEFPYIFIVSRRGPPILKQLEVDELFIFIRRSFIDKLQCDLVLAKEDLRQR
jgi:FkbM family methyltransferase